MPAAAHRRGQRQSVGVCSLPCGVQESGVCHARWQAPLHKEPSQRPLKRLYFRLSLKCGSSPHPSLENDHSEEVQERPVWANSPQLLTTWPLTGFRNNHCLEFSQGPTHQTCGSCPSPKSQSSFRRSIVPLPPRSPSPPRLVRSCLPHGFHEQSSSFLCGPLLPIT